MVSINSSVGKSSCKRIRKSSNILRKERASSNKKIDNNSAYDTTLSAVLDRYGYSVNMRLKGNSVEICRAIIHDINNTLLASSEKKVIRTTLQRY